MSLILEALKKLDREKQAPDRGLLVVGPSSWPSAREGRSTATAGAVVKAALALAVLAGGVWLLRSPKAPAPVPAPAAAPAPVPAASPATAGAPVAARTQLPASGHASVPASVPGSVPATTPAPVPASGPTPAPVPPPARTALPRAPIAPTSESASVKAPRASPPTDRFQLQAISQRDGQPVAVLNDQLVREGDTFDGVRVLRIGADEVEIEVAGHRRVVKF